MTPVRDIGFGGDGRDSCSPRLSARLVAVSVGRVQADRVDVEEAMAIALDEAAAAVAHGDVPVGAVVLATGTGSVLARRHNEREQLSDPTAHAELLALRDAAAALGTWRLTATTLVVTLEPCPMCAGALVAARVGRLVFGATDPKAGACGSLYNLCADPRLNHELPVVTGVRAAESAALLTAFFADRRAGPSGTL
jgi:tRNA(adenine34) deaminase